MRSEDEWNEENEEKECKFEELNEGNAKAEDIGEEEFLLQKRHGGLYG